MKIEANRITARQKLIIEKGLCDYRYIMSHWQNNDSDFQSVYYDFYLKARWAVMNKSGNKDPYFNKLQSISPDDSLMDILDDLKTEQESKSYELSLGSKLLYTRNPASPIYDSKIRKYLSEEELVDFWWHNTVKGHGAPRGVSEREKIEHDWQELRNWYTAFMTSQRGKEWIAWFNANFPNDAHISDVKKIDFIIFVTN